MTTPGEPETEAGRRLLDELAVWEDEDSRSMPWETTREGILAIEAEARAAEAEKWSAVFDDEKWGIRKARREAEARAESSAEMERLRAAMEDNPCPWCGGRASEFPR